MEAFHIITTRSVGKEVAKIREAFEKKRELEHAICKMIKDYENNTGLSIDSIHYQRDITLPIQGSKYTSLSILITPEEDTSTW